jgi:ankyrin repeat protein
MPKKKPDAHTLEEVRRAIEADSPVLLEPLLKAGVPADQKIGDGPGKSLIVLAIEQNAVKVARLLIAAAAKLDRSRDKPLIHAALFNRPEILELLLKAGADPNVTVSNPDEDVRGETALMYAVDLPEKIRIVELLLKHGADPNLADSKGQTALYHAVDSDNLEAVRRLLAARAKPVGVELHGLIYRCTRDSLEMLKLLIAAGANLNALGTRDSHFCGYTALEAAKGSYKEQTELIDQLSRRRREAWEEQTLERWKAEAQIYEAMIDELSHAEQPPDNTPCTT